MKNINYAGIANNLLGDKLYCKFIKEISKENNGADLVTFGKKVVDKCCLLVVALGMSNSIKMNKAKIYVGNEMVEINCKEFAKKYGQYVNEIEKHIEV